MLTPADIFSVLALLGNILSFVYLAVFLLFLWATWKFVGKTMADHKQRRLLQSAACLAVTALFMIPIGKDYMERRAYIREQQAKQDEFQARYNKAKAIFDERCKTAGEKIYHTVEGIEGITLLNVPQEYRHEFGSDPMWEGAGLPGLSTGNYYISMFLDQGIVSENLEPKRRINPNPRKVILNKEEIVYFGYRYVDVKQGNNYFRYHYHNIMIDDTMIIELIKEKPSRYIVEFLPNLDHSERQLWVAGLTINVYDSETNTLMASKTWYSMEPGMGNRNQRIPWHFAITCPETNVYSDEAIRLFVDQVVKPKQGD